MKILKLLLLLLVLFVTSYAEDKISLAKKEISFSKEHPTVALRSDENGSLDTTDKAISTTNKERAEERKNDCISVKHDQQFSEEFFWYIVIAVILLVLFSVFRQFILNRYNKKLEEKVLKKVEELREKDELLFQKYRMAAMGEMLSMIAHQWRQPLGAISSAIMSIDVKLASGKFDLEDRDSRNEFMDFLEKKHNSINDYVHYLSETTDDFRNFFNPNRDKEETPLTKPIVNALNILQNFLEKHNISIIKDFQIDDHYLLYQNEIMQVIISMLKNSEENFSINETKDPTIVLRTYREENYYVISICDNGGGVPDEIKEKIFEPYFSTKKAKNGTGLGLYMSKIMIEDHHGGTLSVENIDGGACFYIKFNSPLSHQ
ncbi:histidine kinase [hydrothermal vent metagenome]|uniref:Histidine kinase n=1 Tax=hydrothermal vent metagenome TaxID=652676 RepID=A0A1W1BQE9_9ZZZZ